MMTTNDNSRPRRRMSRSVVFAAASIAAVVAAIALHDRRSQKAGETQIRSLVARLSGDTRFGEVLSWISGPEYATLRLRNDEPAATPRTPELIIETPLTLGARNWVLQLHFGDDMLLRASHVGTVDSLRGHPHDAPMDTTY